MAHYLPDVSEMILSVPHPPFCKGGKGDLENSGYCYSPFTNQNKERNFIITIARSHYNRKGTDNEKMGGFSERLYLANRAENDILGNRIKIEQSIGGGLLP